MYPVELAAELETGSRLTTGEYARYLDYSYLGLFVPCWTVLTMDGLFVPYHWTIRTMLRDWQKLTPSDGRFVSKTCLSPAVFQLCEICTSLGYGFVIKFSTRYELSSSDGANSSRYEQSMDGTNSPPIVRIVRGTNSPWTVRTARNNSTQHVQFSIFLPNPLAVVMK